MMNNHHKRFKLSTKENNINVLLLSIGAIAGNLRHILDIIENIDSNRFNMSISYKPECNRWTHEDLRYIRNQNVNLYQLRGKHLLNLYGIIDIVKIIKKESIDIIHCFDSLGMIARIIGKLFGCKTIHHIGNSPDKNLTRISKPFIFNFLTSFYLDGVTFCGHEVRKSNLSHGFIYWNGTKQIVNHDCVDADKIKASTDPLIIKNKYGIDPRQIILTNIGYFNEQKGQSYLLRCFHYIKMTRQDVTLVIVGWGHLEGHLKMLSLELGIQESVVFTGKLNQDEVYEVLSITDIFVLSSLWEGFGIVTAEAMAHCKPVVSTDTDGSREVIIDGTTGIIVPPKDSEAMAKAILFLLERPILMAEMGKSGKKRVEKYFNTRQFISKHESFYREILKQNLNEQMV